MKTQYIKKNIARFLCLAGLFVLVQTFSTTAQAANPSVDSVLAIEYDSGVFAAAVLAHGTSPLMLSRILVNDVEIDADKTDHIVLGTRQNVTLFKFAKKGAEPVVSPGDMLTAEVTDTNGATTAKTVKCIQGRLFHQLVVCR